MTQSPTCFLYSSHYKLEILYLLFLSPTILKVTSTLRCQNYLFAQSIMLIYLKTAKLLSIYYIEIKTSQHTFTIYKLTYPSFFQISFGIPNYLIHRNFTMIFPILTTLWKKQMACSNELSQYCLYFFPPAKRGKQKWLPWKVENTDCYLLICHYIRYQTKQQGFLLEVEFQACARHWIHNFCSLSGSQ